MAWVSRGGDEILFTWLGKMWKVAGCESTKVYVVIMNYVFILALVAPLRSAKAELSGRKVRLRWLR